MIKYASEKIIRLGGRIIFLCLLASVSILHAQQYYFDKYSVSEGLAQSTVYAVIQDRNDNYWLGTQAGVSLFDGVEFTNFTAEDGLAENGVRSICEDDNGFIWFGHDNGGVSRFDGETFEIFRDAELHLTSTISSIVQDTTGNLWLTSAQSGAAMIPDPGAPIEALKYEMFMGSRLADRVFGSFLTDDGKLYFITDPVVKLFNRDSAKFENLVLNGIPRYFATTSILVDRQDNFWFGTHHGGLYKYIPEEDDTKMYDLIKLGMTSNWVSTLYEDKYGNVWVGTWGGGIARISTDDDLTVFDHRNGMPGGKIWQIMEDEEGNVLIGTHENGLCAFKGDYFVSFFENDGLINPQVWAIEQARDGRYWIGTNQGVSILDYSSEKASMEDFRHLQGDRVRFIEEDKKGNIWITAEGQGVFTYGPSGSFSFEPLVNRNLAHGQITGMCIDSENNLWVGTLDGLVYFEIDNRRVSKLTQLSGLAGSEVSAVYADSRDHIWVGIEGKGMTIIKGSDFIVPSIDMEFTPTCFVEDLEGNIWIGTEGRGVMVYDMDNDAMVRQYTTDEGLLANLINLVNCDESNNIYIGTNKGLNKLFHDGGNIIGFTRKNGFVGIETNENATCLGTDGNIWFGTVQGVTRYDPHLKPRDVMDPLTHITGLMVNYERYPIEEGMSLSHSQNSLIFDYRCITLNPEAVQYRIMLEGIDKDWRPPSQHTQVNYPALPPGKYTFFVKARNSDGIWNDPPVSFSFQIKPPFYLTWWFILSCVIAAGFIIFAYIKVRERALRRENRILEEKVQARTAEVVAQKEELAEKNKDITDSIRYAKRIQFAILPPESPFPDTFILFKPKDIVSGDFYWFTIVDGREYIAAVDCTGHGVPGAFMSIIGHSSLNKIVNQYGILEPGKILDELNKEVVGTLHQRGEGGDVNDGMDLSIIAYDTRHQRIEYAGAYNPMYLVRNGELIETKGDRQPIGRVSGAKMTNFTTQIVEVQKGDTIYLFSDGYADQFGGSKLKKFKSKNMKELLVKVAGEPMNVQRELLDRAIEEWRGNVEQIDDILVIGRRF